MKKLLISFAVMAIAAPTFADTGSGGMAECISLSVNAALLAYAQNHQMSPIPSVLATKSDAPPSNGVDVKVTINGSMVYYVIGQAVMDQSGPSLLGCSAATVYKVEPIGG